MKPRTTILQFTNQTVFVLRPSWFKLFGKRFETFVNTCIVFQYPTGNIYLAPAPSSVFLLQSGLLCIARPGKHFNSKTRVILLPSVPQIAHGLGNYLRFVGMLLTVILLLAFC